MNKKLILLITIFLVTSLLTVNISLAQQQCETAIIKSALRKALFDYFKSPSQAKLDLAEIKDLLTFYLSIAEGQITVNCNVKGNETGIKMDKIVDEAEKIITTLPTCPDGTTYGECSATKPKYCYAGELRDVCDICGCPSGYTCQDNKCVSTTTSSSCTDSDGGNNTAVKGFTTWGPIDGKYYNATDGCSLDGTILSEYYCYFSQNLNGYYSTVAYFTCPNGCSDGACTVSNATTNVTNVTKTNVRCEIDYNTSVANNVACKVSYYNQSANCTIVAATSGYHLCDPLPLIMIDQPQPNVGFQPVPGLSGTFTGINCSSIETVYNTNYYFVNCKNPTALGACVVRDAFTSLPALGDPDAGKGYAKQLIYNVSTIEGLKTACTNETYKTLLTKYCQSNNNSVQYQVMNSTSSTCDDSGCNFHSCNELITCTPNWNCSAWSTCTNGTQARICTDLNKCGTTSGKPAESQSCTTNVTALSFSKVASIIKSRSILTKLPEIDFDNDGKKEFIFTDFWTSSSTSTAFNIYESSSDNSFVSVSRLLTESGSLVSYYLADVGDSDNDSKKELLTYGRSDNNFYTRVYEASANNTYPSVNVWQAATGWWTVGARIDDLDKDGIREIVFAGQNSTTDHKIQVFENTGNNAYSLVWSTSVPDVHTSQCFDTMSDLDGDGKKEVVFGGLVSGSSWLHMYENTGDNSFAEIWSYELKYSDGNPLNCAKVIFAGDTDGDGKKEFIVGGLRSAPLGTPVIAIYYIFETNGTNSFQKITEITKSMELLGETSANVADLDNDGRNEIIIATENSAALDGIYVFKNSGSNAFSEIWNHTWARPGTTAQWLDGIGVGDHDGDGKPEIIFNEYTTDVNTVLYERTS